MGKPRLATQLRQGEAMAVSRTLRVSPRKLTLVASAIRGKHVHEALSELQFSKRRIAKDVRKCLMSAVANAENNHLLDVDYLYVSEAFVGKRLVMKRMRPVARGRGHMIRKPYSQLTVIVRTAQAESEEEDES